MLEETITTTSAEKAILAAAVDATKASRVLEIGAFHGKTTAVLSHAVRKHGGHVVVVDPMKWASAPADLLERIGGWFQRSNYERSFWSSTRAGAHDNVVLIRALSTDPTLLARKNDLLLREFDLIFIDGGHTYSIVASDLAQWGARVRPGGRILLHDAIPRFDGVMRAIRQYEGLPGIDVQWPGPGSTICTIAVENRFTLTPAARTSRAPGRGAADAGSGSERAAAP